ncbi:hypothetical protein ILYODFUR_016211, partial [Ilyodon furcidens]
WKNQPGGISRRGLTQHRRLERWDKSAADLPAGSYSRTVRSPAWLKGGTTGRQEML